MTICLTHVKKSTNSLSLFGQILPVANIPVRRLCGLRDNHQETTTKLHFEQEPLLFKAPPKSVESDAKIELKHTHVGDISKTTAQTEVTRREDEPSLVHTRKQKRELYRSVGILTSLQFIGNLGFGSVIPVLPIFAASMGLGPSGVGMILSASALSRLIATIPSGRLSDAGYGRKPLMISGALISSLSSLGTASRFLLGIGGSLSLAGSGAYLADLTQAAPSLRAKIMGFQATVLNSSYAFGPALGGFLCDLYGARMSFVFVAVANLLASMGYWFLPESDSCPTKDTKHEKKSTYRDYQQLFNDRNQQCLMLVNFSLFTSYATTMTIIPLHFINLTGSADGNTGKVGLLFAFGAIIGTIGAPIGGWLADRFGRKATIFPSSVLAAVGTCACSGEFVTDFESLLPPLMLWSLGNSMMQPAMIAFAADIAEDGQTRGQALSVSRMAGDAGFLFSPIALGVLAELFSCEFALKASAFLIIGANSIFILKAQERYKVRKMDS